MPIHKIVKRLYYVDATLNRRSRRLELTIQAFTTSSLLSPLERRYIKSAAKARVNTVSVTADDPKTSLIFEIAGVERVRDALKIIRDITGDSDSRFRAAGIDLCWDPGESSLKTVTD